MSEIDVHSKTWRAVKAWVEERIESNRIDLETPGLPDDQTEQLRGAIRDLRQLLRLPEPSRMKPIESTVDVD